MLIKINLLINVKIHTHRIAYTQKQPIRRPRDWILCVEHWAAQSRSQRTTFDLSSFLSGRLNVCRIYSFP